MTGEGTGGAGREREARRASPMRRGRAWRGVSEEWGEMREDEGGERGKRKMGGRPLGSLPEGACLRRLS